MSYKTIFHLAQVEYGPIEQPISKKRLIKKLYDLITPHTRGFFHDESWQPIHKVWEIFNETGLDWNITGSRYDGSMPPERKEWKFEINFTNNRGRPDKIYGNIVAAGGGSVEDPLERFDVTVVMSDSRKKTTKIARRKERIPGGMAEGKNVTDFDPSQLAKGTKVEMKEHSTDPNIATEIAMDHLEEAGDCASCNGAKYYNLLENMEKKIEKRKKNESN